MISHHFDNPRFRVNFKMKFYFFLLRSGQALATYMYACPLLKENRNFNEKT